MGKAIVLCDFDGTITGIAGNQVVLPDEVPTSKQEFYQSLFSTKGVFYADATILSSPEIQAKFKQKFGDIPNYEHEDSDILMDPDAVVFFHEMLSKTHPDVYIISRNRMDYIKNIFKYHGFTDDEINKLVIFAGFDKKYAVSCILDINDEDILLILDDSKKDLDRMVAGLPESIPEKNIIECNEKPGKFRWKDYLTLLSSIENKNSFTPSLGREI